MDSLRITIIGTGYVGISNAVLLAQKNNVTAFDIDKKRVEMINNKISPIKDIAISDFLENQNLQIQATCNSEIAYKNADFIIICVPTNYDAENSYFDTSIVEMVIANALKVNKMATIIIKSTIPFGFTENIKTKFNYKNIFFSPEFLREGSALKDNLYPSRIVVGSSSQSAKNYVDLMLNAAKKKEVNTYFVSNSEAESIKLFANTYLAMRVSFFNELDNFSITQGLNAKNIIEGICSDDRIGNGYNNPSYGYGGYCLPKDTKQLLANYSHTPNAIIESIVKSNKIRKDFITKLILEKKPNSIGVYKLAMKTGSDNFRDSSIIDVVSNLRDTNPKIEIIIYEPFLNEDKWMKCTVTKDINTLKNTDLIIANRSHEELRDIKEKLFTRDIYGTD